MTLADKKSYVLRYMRLGMDSLSAMIASECTEEEIDSLEADKDFQRKALISVKVEEARMLEQFERARANNIALNDTRDTRWILEKVDPDRFGTGFKKKGSGKNIVGIQIDFGDNDDIGDDNTEEFDGEGEEL